ncbi:FlgD Ig-like domain protein [compost metagenome]
MVDTTKGMTGAVVIPQSVAEVAVKITDKDGKTVRTITLDDQKAGNASFTWDGKDDAGNVASVGTYTFAAATTIDEQSVALITNLPATVTSVTLSQTGGELMLNLAGLGSIALSKVQTIGI